MAGNPLISQGVLNRIRGSIVIPNFPELNVTAPYLGKPGIRLSLEGQATSFIDTLTGAVVSGEPYQIAMVQIALLKTQALANSWKAQMELLSAIGNITVIPDATTLGNYDLTNCAIETVAEQSYAGEEAVWAVSVKGYYNVNSSLWDLI